MICVVKIGEKFEKLVKICISVLILDFGGSGDGGDYGGGGGDEGGGHGRS